MTEDQIIDRINGARCMECGTTMGSVEVRDLVEETTFGDVDEITDALYDAKPCNCDATMIPMILSDVPVFDDAEVDDDYRIRGQNGQPDQWTYEVDGDLLDLVS